MAERNQTALAVMPAGPERDLVVSSLAAIDLHVSVAEEPYEAYAKFVDGPANLIVLSLEGLTPGDRAFLRQARRLSPPVRVLMLVPEGRRQDAVAFLEAGADSVLPQTFLIAELQLIVRSLLRSEAADPLTGLPNRPSYERALPGEIARASRDGTTLALGLADIDGFGAVNAKLGYSLADETLVEVSRRLDSAFRHSDLLARWGGEEFVVHLPALPKALANGKEHAREVLERARLSVADRPVEVSSGQQEHVTVCVGYALFPHDLPGSKRPADKGLGADECKRAGRRLFDLANKALKCAKEQPDKNKVVWIGDVPEMCPDLL